MPPNSRSGDNGYGSIQHARDDEAEQQQRPLIERGVEKLSVNRAMVGLGLVTAAVIYFSYSILSSSSEGFIPSSELENTPPLSTKSPDKELGLQGVYRVEGASPSSIWGEKANEGPLPTNSWYLNLVSHRAENPDDETRVYTTPYIIDTAAANEIAGIRVHWPVIQASDHNIQMINDFKNSLTLGSSDLPKSYQVDQDEDLSQLGVSLRWTKSDVDDNDNEEEEKESFMKTHIVRGMPYATMVYAGDVLPSIFSYNAPASDIIVDDDNDESPKVLECGVLDHDGAVNGATAVTVEKELKMHFINSDFTWLLFFSQPVVIECGISEGDIQISEFQMNVKSTAFPTEPLFVRLALVDQCTTGKADIQMHCSQRMESADLEEYVAMLRKSSSVFPTSPRVHLEYSKDDDEDHSSSAAYINFDWMAKSSNKETSSLEDLVMFALPHHQEHLTEDTPITTHCVKTFHGRTCLVKGNKWSLHEDLGTGQSFTANRPPEAAYIPDLAESLSQDIQYNISDNLMRGAADTYFSGKILAKVARTILIASELQQLADGSPADVQSLYTDLNKETDLLDSTHAVQSSHLPSNEHVLSAIERLKKAVQVWLGDAEAPYVYDKSWGGLVNCGCIYVGEGDRGTCNNTFPDCPALESVNQDFGNGFYNDHHFHYGYHVYTAAVVAKFDPKWGKEHFEKILLYIRDYANPSDNDGSFTPFRQKDWWLGSSWASGFVSAENSPHGRDQESSSEAIAAYEAMALFGQVMTDVMQKEGGTKEEKESAKLIQNTGELLTMTEIKAANRYWHVYSSDTHNNTYPAEYKEPVVGMLYDTMASFQTWFSSYPLVSYGIQLMPFTPVAEMRDDPKWASQLYPQYVDSCESAGDFCIDNGWSIIQSGLCATTGSRDDALKQALAIPEEVFRSDGGVGQSMSNTIWYIATRKDFAMETN